MTAAGYSRLVLRPNGAEISFVPVGGTYTDRTALTCHGDLSAAETRREAARG